MKVEIKIRAKEVIDAEINSLVALRDLVSDHFVEIVNTIHLSNSQIVVCGVGKSAIIAQKIVATLNSTGSPSMFLHAADAIHGDAGMIRAEDVVIILSNSGETPEAIAVGGLIKSYGNYLVAMVSRPQSSLARLADGLLLIPQSPEADQHGIVPTSSTAAQMALGDALAVSLMELKGFTKEKFAKFHPGGNLGKKLYLKTNDLYQANATPAIKPNATLSQIITSISDGGLGATTVIDQDNHVIGVITDGDLRRMLLIGGDQSQTQAVDIMTTDPVTLQADTLAVEAVALAQSHNVSQIIVVDDGKYVGMIHLHDLIREGLV